MVYRSWVSGFGFGIGDCVQMDDLGVYGWGWSEMGHCDVEVESGSEDKDRLMGFELARGTGSTGFSWLGNGVVMGGWSDDDEYDNEW